MKFSHSKVLDKDYDRYKTYILEHAKLVHGRPESKFNKDIKYEFVVHQCSDKVRVALITYHDEEANESWRLIKKTKYHHSLDDAMKELGQEMERRVEKLLDQMAEGDDYEPATAIPQSDGGVWGYEDIPSLDSSE